MQMSSHFAVTFNRGNHRSSKFRRSRMTSTVATKVRPGKLGPGKTRIGRQSDSPDIQRSFELFDGMGFPVLRFHQVLQDRVYAFQIMIEGHIGRHRGCGRSEFTDVRPV
jgi:hypothetical protein